MDEIANIIRQLQERLKRQTAGVESTKAHIELLERAEKAQLPLPGVKTK